MTTVTRLVMACALLGKDKRAWARIQNARTKCCVTVSLAPYSRGSVISYSPLTTLAPCSVNIAL